MSVTVSQLIERHENTWQAATSDEFLDRVRDGTLPEAAFTRWLEQDYLFVVGLTRAWGRLLTLAPVEDLALISTGISAFTSELAWFTEIAGSRGLRLGRKADPRAAAYIAYLNEVAVGPYAAAITAMWTVEAAYLSAWQGARGGSERYAEIIEHWAGEEFERFVARLASAAERELHSSPELCVLAEECFVTVARYESVFWSLAENP